MGRVQEWKEEAVNTLKTEWVKEKDNYKKEIERKKERKNNQLVTMVSQSTDSKRNSPRFNFNAPFVQRSFQHFKGTPATPDRMKQII